MKKYLLLLVPCFLVILLGCSEQTTSSQAGNVKVKLNKGEGSTIWGIPFKDVILTLCPTTVDMSSFSISPNDMIATSSQKTGAMYEFNDIAPGVYKCTLAHNAPAVNRPYITIQVIGGRTLTYDFFK